jgi:predicted RecB family nuclease
MNPTSLLFGAFLNCPTKCYLLSTGQAGSGNAYADWVQAQNDAHQRETAQRLTAEAPEHDRVVTAPAANDLKTATWTLALNLNVDAGTMETRLHGVERMAAQGRGKPPQFVPIRFIPRNKLTKDDRLLVAYDALVLSKATGLEVSLGKIMHGDDHATVKVKIPGLVSEAHKLTGKVTALLGTGAPPDLVLNRHCSECEFRDGCRQKAVAKDDLSLLSGMKEKDRQKYNRKGIFTVSQLSYTFRPRRRPKRLRDKRERYHQSLKALAIRAQKIHIVGSPALTVDGTPVYLDVEGLPDADLYYLIGIRFQTAETIIRHSLWADNAEAEKQIWTDFLRLLAGIEKPVLFHYGTYETTFLKKMCKRHGSPPQDSLSAKAITSTVNVLSFISGQLYFPTHSDGLKPIAAYLGFNWSEPKPSGLNAVVWRKTWEMTKATGVKDNLLDYNQEDCDALERTTTEVRQICSKFSATPDDSSQRVVDVASLRSDAPYHFGKMEFAIPDFEPINQAAYWDYQHDRIRIRNHDQAKSGSLKISRRRKRAVHPNRQIASACASSCPHCNASAVLKTAKVRKVVQDLRFSTAGIKRWASEYLSQRYSCAECGARFVLRPEGCPSHKEGSGLLAYVVYQLIQHRVSQRSVADSLMELFHIDRPRSMVHRLKARAACIYRKTREQMMSRLVQGSVVHVDETDVSIGGKRMFVWVFSNSKETVYYSTLTREADFPTKTLTGFKGVLVSDFYPAYDSIPCVQQKCLIHLMRDVNNDLLRAPFDQELKSLALEFGAILKALVKTIDRFGLKTRFLTRHKKVVARFYRELAKRTYQSDIAAKYQGRFQKEQKRLFVFLDHDGVPWNNNNAEHAIKSFAMLRTAIGGCSTENGIADYLVLLSILETCKCKGVSFLGFLRSGEIDIDIFAKLKGSARPSHP